MRLNNDALQELYDTLSYGPVLSSPYTESPIDRAFKECDEKLSESIAFDFLKKLQDRCDNLERSNKALRDDNDKLGDKTIELKKKHDAKSKENATLISANADLSDRLAKLQRNYDRINSLWTSQIQENMELRSKIADLKREKEELVSQDDEISKLKKDLDDAKNQLAYFTLSRDNWRSRAKHAEDEVEDLKNKYAKFEKRINELLDQEDNLIHKIKELDKNIEGLEASRKHLCRLHVGEGARKLWDMLQNVNDSQPYEFDVECESMEDVVGMDLDDFLDAYKKWQKEKEQNETDRMRDWLVDFCWGRVCEGCPLESKEYKCGCGYSFRKVDRSDDRIIPDKDIKRYYEKARGIERYKQKPISTDIASTYPSLRFKPKEEAHKLDYGDADNKITENLRKGCTLEATVEVDKDLLTKVCGVVSKEEEHKLDYGDAVRVPWKSYDYMSIGPEGKHIRLFDPKTHTVVLVSVTDNLTYQGCKIILCDEDDIRKIWKDKK